MFSSLRLITFADASVAMREKTRQLLADAAASTGRASTLFAPTAPRRLPRRRPDLARRVPRRVALSQRRGQRALP
jgi:hypothetical protein